MDQLTKRLVLQHLRLDQFISLGVLGLRRVHNTGAAFGMLPDSGRLFVTIAVLVLLAIAFNYHRLRQADPLYLICLGLVSGGTLGNLADRLRFGFVVDFIDFRWWPVFNVADSAICIGVAVLAWRMARRPPEVSVAPPMSIEAPPTPEGDAVVTPPVAHPEGGVAG